VCKAELIHDAPFALALGASVLSSLVLPTKSGGAHEEGEHGDGAMVRLIRDWLSWRLSASSLTSIGW
jgi:hypothetical protein